MSDWRKSTRCGGSATCVYVRAWRKARACQGSNGCVDVGAGPDCVAFRDSTDETGPMIVIAASDFRRFLKAAKAL